MANSELANDHCLQRAANAMNSTGFTDKGKSLLLMHSIVKS